MPDRELNHAEKWTVPPVAGAVLQGAGVTALLREGIEQQLVSGDLAAFARASGFGPAGAAGPSGGYSLGLARDRLLAVGPLPGIAPGWQAGGFAVSPIGAGLAVIEVSGAGLPDLLARAVTVDPASPGPSAATTFAGVPAILDLLGDGLRLHVERGLTACLWSWLAAAIGELSA